MAWIKEGVYKLFLLILAKTTFSLRKQGKLKDYKAAMKQCLEKSVLRALKLCFVTSTPTLLSWFLSPLCSSAVSSVPTSKIDDQS